MRYQALEISSGILRASGYLLGILALIGGIGVGWQAHLATTPRLEALWIGAGIGVAFGGAVLAMIVVACGQLICVLVDIEHNTRCGGPEHWAGD